MTRCGGPRSREWVRRAASNRVIISTDLPSRARAAPARREESFTPYDGARNWFSGTPTHDPPPPHRPMRPVTLVTPHDPGWDWRTVRPGQMLGVVPSPGTAGREPAQVRRHGPR